MWDTAGHQTTKSSTAYRGHKDTAIVSRETSENFSSYER